jgi:hypothetical protein
MNCNQAQAGLSLAIDGELPTDETEPLRVHVIACPACTRFNDQLRAIRHGLRFEALGEVPDVAPRVLTAIGGTKRPRRRRLSPVAAAFLAGAILGATFIGVGGGRPTRVANANLPERVVAAQHAVISVAADLRLVERGWHQGIRERLFTGRLRYHAPESLQVQLVDRTPYPSAVWVRSDMELVVTGDRWWMRAPRACPVEALPECTPRKPVVRLVTHREPFADTTPVPLDLVTPVRSFALAGAQVALGSRRIAGRRALGVLTTVAQVQPLLGGLDPAGNLRGLYSSDRVELWLDQAALVPLALRVVATAGAERDHWAASRGYHDTPGSALLELTLDHVALNRSLPPGSFPPPAAGVAPQDDGFIDGLPGTSTVPAPKWLPAGFRRYRDGIVATRGGPTVAVRTWTDGRAWIKVRATRDWPGGRLFGDLGQLVRPVPLGGGRVGYASEDGTRIAVHGSGTDVLVTGSLAVADLQRVAGNLGLAGLPVPRGWAEAPTATLAQALAAVPGLLLPRGLRGFGPPAARVDGAAVSLAFAGPGTRAFLLVETIGIRLDPPLDSDVQGVRVRGFDGRYTAARGELEWVEHGRTLSLRSGTLSLDELLGIAQSLERP